MKNESKIKVGTIVIAPCDSNEGSKINFKKGDEFEVEETYDDWDEKFGISFNTKVGFCLEKKCSHINDMDWIIKEETKQDTNDKN